MRESQVAVFIHLVWATWDRVPLLTAALQRPVYRAIGAICGECGAEVIAVGGVEDHVHLLIRLPATLTVAELAKHVKGASAHLVTHQLAPNSFFKWQGSYGAFSVSPHDLPTVGDYIARQAEHHAAGVILPEWELPPAPSKAGGGEAGG